MFLCRSASKSALLSSSGFVRSRPLLARNNHGLLSLASGFSTDSKLPLTKALEEDLQLAMQKHLDEKDGKKSVEPVTKIVNGREVIIPKPLPTKFNKSTMRLIESEENTSIRGPRLARWKAKQKRRKLRNNPWKDYMIADARLEPKVEYEKPPKSKPIPTSSWKNLPNVETPFDFAILEKEYSSCFEEKVKTRKNLWYHRKAHKRANHFIQHLNKELVDDTVANSNPIPDFTGGDALEVQFKGNMAAKRDNIFRGVCLGRRNAGISSSFKIIGVIDETPVEYTFPLYSPLITKIRLVKKGFIKKDGKRVRRAKVYYIRDLPQSVYTVTKADMQAADAQDRRDATAAKKAAKKLRKQQEKEARAARNKAKSD